MIKAAFNISNSGQINWAAFGQVMLEQLIALQPETPLQAQIADDIVVTRWMLAQNDSAEKVRIFCLTKQQQDRPGYSHQYRDITNKLGWLVPRG